MAAELQCCGGEELSETGGKVWRFTCIYGEAHEGQKHKIWRLMEDLAQCQQNAQAWLCAGDFKENLIAARKGWRKPTATSVNGQVQASFGGVWDA